MSSPCVRYTLLPEITPELEADALMNVYAYLIKTHESKKAAEPAPELDSSDEMRKGEDAHTRTGRQ